MTKNVVYAFATSRDVAEEIEKVLVEMPQMNRSRLCEAAIKAAISIPPAELNKLREGKPLDVALTELVHAGRKELMHDCE